uniref:response regulator transcription factor n=1 Tax=Acetatifactor sp. TaxID=1872090 RepID=UPI0040574D38
MNRKIVVFNNHTGIVERIKPLLAEEGIEICVASTPERLMKVLEVEDVHLMLIDVELKEQAMGAGIELITKLRAKSPIPIIVVSEQEADTAKVMALNAGADDYVTAGCNPLELLARVKSQLRRYIQLVNLCVNIDSIYKVDGLEVDDNRRTVYVDGREVKLTPIEYKILRLLIQQSGRVLSIDQIYEAIWQMQPIGADNTIAVHIRHIREKIESNPKEPRYLKVVWGTGYKVG